MAFTYCENCGEKIDDGCKFCPNCGYSKSGVNGSVGDKSMGDNAYVGGNQNGAQNPYGNPQNNYGNQQNPYGNPQSPYGNPQSPYGNPQSPYGNSQSPYGNYQPPYGNGQQPYGGQPRKVNTGIVVFSVIVLALFSPIFGIIALVMALNAPKEPTEELMEKKNKTAMILCIVGVVVSIVISIIFVALMVMAGAMGY